MIKGGVPEGKTNAVDAITGATMTSKGLSAAIAEWLKAYRPILENAQAVTAVVDTLSEVAGEIKTVEE